MTVAAALLIVALGDSTTAGTPFFKSPIEVSPSGIKDVAPNQGSGDATAPFCYQMTVTHPDWTVLNRGVNGERSGRSADYVTAQLKSMYDKARAAKIPVIAGSIVPYNTATAEQNARMHAINDWIRAEATRDSNVTFVDTRKAAAIPDNTDLLASSPDGLHPSIAGYHRMGDVIAAAIVTRIGRQP